MESSENGKRKRRPCNKHQDLISQLPDDILVSIISHLNLGEATTTSILSSRWRCLPTYITRLNFPSFIPKFKTSKDSVIEENLISSFPHNTDTINRVLDSHKGCQVKEFRVHMYCWKGANLDRWFEFALARDVEIIHIHMDCVKYNYRHARDHYSLRANLNLVGESLNCLKELSLLGINVNDSDIQLLLNKFPLLESLSIGHSNSLRHVSIVGNSSSKLKHLEISRATDLQLIEIDNFENLVSIWCAFNSAFSLNLKNVPKLSELSMSDMTRCTSARILSQMSPFIQDQLQTLKIFTDPLCTDDYIRRMPPQLIGVKNLELQPRLDFIYKNFCSFNPFYIIRACPSLEKLEVKFWKWFLPASKIKVNEDYEKEIILDDWPKEKVCPNLKRMKISGFIGSSMELEFIFSILKNVNTLEELVVEACDENKKIRNLAGVRATRIFGHERFKVVVDRLTVR